MVAPHVRVAYPDADAQCIVEAADGARTVRCAIVTRPVRERLLDLRFQDAVCPNRIALRGDVAQEVLSDLIAMAPDHVLVTFTSAAACFAGTGGAFGSLTVEVGRHLNGVLHFEAGDDTLQPKYLSVQTLHALGGNAHSKDVVFERVAVHVNAERQLCVQHSGINSDADRHVEVQFVVQPLSALLDM